MPARWLRSRVERARGDGKSPSSRWGYWVIVVCILYPLSIGPAAGFYGGTTNPWLRMSYETCYAPLLWANERVPVLETTVKWYIELWWKVCWKDRAWR